MLDEDQVKFKISMNKFNWSHYYWNPYNYFKGMLVIRPFSVLCFSPDVEVSALINPEKQIEMEFYGFIIFMLYYNP